MLMRMAGAPERGFSTAELAEEFGLSRHHLTKIMQRLAGGRDRRDPARRRRRRGAGAAGGGDPARRGGAAAGGGAGRWSPASRRRRRLHLEGRCRLKLRLRAAEAAFLADLDRSTLADIALPARGCGWRPDVPAVERTADGFVVDASLLAEAFRLPEAEVRARMQDGRITSRCEAGGGVGRRALAADLLP